MFHDSQYSVTGSLIVNQKQGKEVLELWLLGWNTIIWGYIARGTEAQSASTQIAALVLHYPSGVFESHSGSCCP